MAGQTKKAIVSFLFLTIVSVTSVASADAKDAKYVSVNQLIEEALVNNPDLAAARGQWEAASARVLPAGLPPNPTLGLGYGMIPRDDFALGNAGMRTVSVSQKIPFPGKLYSNNRKASHIAGVAGQIFRVKEREIVKRVKDTYYDLYAIHESIRITEEVQALLRSLARIAETKYAVGKSAAGDVLKAHVGLARIENDLITFEEKMVTQEARMNALLDRPIGESLGVPERPLLKPLSATLEELNSLALSNRPQLLATKEMARAASSAHLTSKMDYLPDFMLTVKQQDVDVGMDTWEVMFSAEIPLWMLFKENKRLQETGARLASAQASVQDATNSALSAVESTYARYDRARKTLELYETGILPQAEMSLESAQAAYVNDTRDFLSLLDSERSLLKFRLEYARAQADYEKSIAELEVVVGIDLPRE